MTIARSLRHSAIAVCALTGSFALPAAAQQELKFQGPVKIFAGFAAGGQSDILARLVADRLKDKLGRPVVVENKPGAGGRIAVETVKPMPPDGSALALANIAQMSTAPLVFTDLTYDAVKDFTPISKAVDFQVALATGTLTKARDYEAMIAWLKANPDKGSSGVPAIGGLPHLFGIQLGKATDLKLTAIPYRGGQPILAALVQGDLAMGWGGVADFIEQHERAGLEVLEGGGDVFDVAAEGREILAEALLITDVGPDLGHRSEHHFGGRNHHAALSHEDVEPNGLDADGLAARVGTGNQDAVVVKAEFER